MMRLAFKSPPLNFDEFGDRPKSRNGVEL